jgi:hypothetical protein
MGTTMIILDTPAVILHEADDYFDSRLNSDDWLDSTDQERNASLIAATMSLKLLLFKDSLSNLLLDSIFLNTFKIATCEVAINLLDGTNMEQEIENLNVESQVYAGVKTGYNPAIVPEHLRAGVPSAIAWNLLKPYLRDPREIKLCRVS